MNRQHIWGILLTFLGAAVAWAVGKAVPIIGGPIIGIVVGMVLAFWRRPKKFDAGITYSSKKILQYAIILLGFEMNLFVIYRVGAQSLILMLATISTALLVAFLAGKLLRTGGKITTLIGVGTAICGGSAIAATAPIIDASDDEVAHAVSTIFLFNVIAAFAFPAIGHAMGMSDASFATWAGTAINDTSSVVAAGYSYSNAAGQLAVVVKLTRALMIVPVTLAIAYLVRVKNKSQNAPAVNTKAFPWFIGGFVAATLVNTFVPIGMFGSVASQVGKYMIIMAMVGIGLNTDIVKLIKKGGRSIILGLVCWIAVAVLAFVLLGSVGAK